MENRRANHICKQEATGCYADFAGQNCTQGQQREYGNEEKDATAVLVSGQHLFKFLPFHPA